MSRFLNSPAGKLLSAALVALALAFLVREMLAEGWAPLLHSLAGLDLSLLVVAAFAYGASLVLLGYAWARCAACLAGDTEPRIAAALRIYAVTTLAKYLPGNVFHYAGRQLAASRCGWPQQAVAKATLIEIVLHMAVVGAMVLILLPVVELPENVGTSAGLLFEARPYYALVPVGLLLVGSLFAFRGFFRDTIYGLRECLSLLLLLQTIFFLASLLIHLWLASSLSLLAEGGVALFAVAYLAAWLAGFVVPGAPGGLGVREAVMVAFLSAYLPSAEVLVFALVSRVVTTLGEALFALGASLMISTPGQAERA